MNPDLRLVAGALLLGSWIALVLSGIVLGGATHLLAVAALAILPWRRRRPASEP